MKVYLVKKEKGRIYRSEDVFVSVAEAEGMEGVFLTHAESGAPVIGGGRSVSVSDTKNYWCCAVAGGPVGIDIEEPRSVRASAARKLHPREIAYLSGLELESREWTAEFLNVWTRKESYMKFCGEGLRLGLAKFSVIDESLDYAASVVCGEYPRGFLRELSLPGGLRGALCSAEDSPRVELVRLQCRGQMAKSVLEKATDLLARQTYTSGELRKKLLSCGYGEEETAFVLSEFTRRGYLDDGDYAQRYARRAAESGKGEKRIRLELTRKGIDGAALDGALAAIREDEGESERERALRAVSGSPCGNEKEKARVARKLASLGYEASVIYDVIDQLKG